MNLRSPAEFYIKYLVAQGTENKAIETRLSAEGLDFISQEYVDGVRDRLPIPAPFLPLDKFHTQSQRFLYREGIQGLFFPDADTRVAKSILARPRAKEFVETMLLSHAPFEAVAKGTSRYRGITCSARAIDLYRHYFWNVDLLDGVSLRALLRLRHESLAQSDKPGDKALARAAQGIEDPRRIAADLPFSPLAAMLVQMRMGMMPAAIRVGERVAAARNLAVIRAEECLYSPSPKDASRALNYAMTAKIMQELLESVQKPDENLHAELQAIALRMDAPPLPSIHELSQGNHTADLQPIATSEEAHDRVLDAEVLESAEPPDPIG